MVSKRNSIKNVGKQGKLDNVTGFSWNLTLDGKVDVEGHNVNLHDTINLQSDSLIGIKQQFAEKLFDSLENSKKRKLAQLVHSTDVQIEKNLEMANKASEMEKEALTLMKKYPELEGDFMVKLKNLVASPVDIQKNLEQEQRYLKIYKILIVEMIKELNKLSDDAKEQGDMEKEKEYKNMYKMLLGDEFLRKKHGSLPDNEVADYEGELGGFLSLHEALWINLNIEGASYKINKGEKYDDKDGRGKIEENIKNVIENKMREKKVGNDFVDFVLMFILEPFGVGDKYDEETLKYYIYSIIDCIKNTDVVLKIFELYEKRKELEEKLKSLDVDLESSKKIDVVLDNIKKSIPAESSYSLGKLEEFKKSVFIEFLEKDNEIGNGVFINDFVNQLRRSKTYEDFVGNELTKLENFGEQSEFLELFCNVLSFLGKQPPEDEGWKNRLRKLYYEMNNDYIGKEEIDLEKVEECLDNMLIWKNRSYEEEWKKLVGNDGVSFIKNRLRNVIIKKRDGVKVKREDSMLFSNYKDICRRTQPWRKKPITLDERKSFINSCFVDILGESVQEFETKESDGDRTLMKNMFNALIDKINSDRKKICDTIGERLAKKQSEKDILENIDRILQKSLGSVFLEFDCTKYDEKRENLKNELKQLKMELSESKNMESYKVLEEKIKNFENEEDFKEFQGYGEILNRCENRETCDISQIGSDGNVIKRLLGLKKLFNSKDLTLEEKFDYSNVILKNITQIKNSKITSKKGEHDEILVSLLGESSVIKKCRVQGAETSENISNGSVHRQKEIKMLDELKFNESEDDKFEKFVMGLNGLGFSNSKSELERLKKELEKLLELLDLKKKKDKLELLKSLFPKSDNIGVELDMIEKKVGKEKLKKLKKSNNNKDKLVKLKKLFSESVNDEEELRRLRKLFPKSVISYIDSCVSENALKLGDSLCAINYNTGDFDFSVIKAGILEKAVEEGKVTNVLEYLGFKFDEGIDRKKIDMEFEQKNVGVSTFASIIQGYRQDKVGCFSDDYLTRGEGNAKLFSNYVRSEGNSRFTIGYKMDGFRFDGKIKGGEFVVERYFSRNKDGENWHNNHENYINNR